MLPDHMNGSYVECSIQTTGEVLLFRCRKLAITQFSISSGGRPNFSQHHNQSHRSLGQQSMLEWLDVVAISWVSRLYRSPSRCADIITSGGDKCCMACLYWLSNPCKDNTAVNYLGMYNLWRVTAGILQKSSKHTWAHWVRRSQQLDEEMHGCDEWRCHPIHPTQWHWGYLWNVISNMNKRTEPNRLSVATFVVWCPKFQGSGLHLWLVADARVDGYREYPVGRPAQECTWWQSS